MKLLHAVERFLKNNWRWIFIAVVALIEISFVWCYKEKFKANIADNDWMKPLLTLIFAAPVAFFLWAFKNHDKQRELNHGERDLLLKENNDAWDNLVKFQEVIDDPNASDGKKTTAILGIGEYYNHKDFKFARQAHALFRVYLTKFWNLNQQWKTKPIKNDSTYEYIKTVQKRIPEYIKAIHEVIKYQSHKKRNGINFFNQWNKEKNKDFQLSFHDFQLQYADLKSANFYEADLSNANLYFTNLSNANLQLADLKNVELSGADLDNVNLQAAQLDNSRLISAHLKNANLTGASLFGVDLSGAELIGTILLVSGPSSNPLKGTKLHGVKYCDFSDAGVFHTQFPAGFDPEDQGMIIIDEFGHKIED